jgi:Cu+-exporting ATPase
MPLDAAATLSLPVTGMTCAGCARKVERVLTAAPGVRAASVNFATETAEIALDGPPGPAVQAIRDAGFGVRLAEHRLAITGMTCAACASTVRRALSALPGVVEADVNIATNTAAVRAVPDAVSPGALVAAVEATGYGATPEADVPAAAHDDGSAERWRRVELAAAVVLTLPFMVQMIGMAAGSHALMMPRWAEAVVAAPVVAVLGRRFFTGALRALRGGAANMDVLVALGAGSAFVVSLWHLAEGGPLYFEAAAVIVTMVLIGKMLEARAKRAATAAVNALLALRPETARILRGGAEVEVAAADVAIGDIVIVRPGERLPVDGTLVRGETTLDESLVTGESAPVSRGPGDAAPSGALNGAGLIRLRAERVGRDATLARIARMVADAQTSRAPAQRLADRVSAVFVPVVVGFAALTFLGWLLAGGTPDEAFRAAVATLVVACPCALGLAAPAALAAGSGAAARAGILVRDVAAMEAARALTHVVFDKTGTLTEGKPRLVAFDGPEEALRLAAGAQTGSEHPLARAMIAAARERGLSLPEPETFEAAPGGGVAATVEGRGLRIGRADYAGGDPAPDLLAAADAAAAQGRTVAWIALDGSPVALAAFEDSPRPEAAEAVAALKARGLSVIMLSGDTRAAAEAAARALGVDEVVAEAKPDDKLAVVRRLREGGAVVAMVGDGVNDAPALAAADLGVAMGGGTDAAGAAAAVTLMRPHLRLVGAAIDISAATARKIRTNLFWAFAYNVVCLPVAALGFLNPGVAAAAMALSSVSVVSNALLLTRWRPA